MNRRSRQARPLHQGLASGMAPHRLSMKPLCVRAVAMGSARSQPSLGSLLRHRVDDYQPVPRLPTGRGAGSRPATRHHRGRGEGSGQARSPCCSGRLRYAARRLATVETAAATNLSIIAMAPHHTADALDCTPVASARVQSSAAESVWHRQHGTVAARRGEVKQRTPPGTSSIGALGDRHGVRAWQCVRDWLVDS